MDDDLNTPQALAVLFDLARDLNRARDGGAGVADAQHCLRELAGVLGLRLDASAGDAIDAAPFIDLLLTIRNELRAAKQFELADRVRNGLTDLGITIEDSAAGSTWKSNT